MASEAFLHLVWQARLYDGLEPITSSGVQSIEVIDPGEYNPHAGPDFFAAKVKIDGVLWVGSIEIHHQSSAWRQHHHDTDPAYSNVILHVVEHHDAECMTSDGRMLPTTRLIISPELRERADYLTRNAERLPCSPLGEGRIPSSLITSELHALAAERLHSKASTIHDLYTQTHDWYETLYITLMRGFGFGLNSEAMERLARSLPLGYIRRQRDHSEQVESLLLGQAGLLHLLPEGDYRDLLEREYAFLARKYDLRPLSPEIWRTARTRPASFPLRRLIQVASLLSSESFSIDQWLSARTPQTYAALMTQARMSEYWYDDRGKGLELSKASRLILVLNIALPLRIAWARMQRQENEALSEAIILAQSLPPEDNRLTRLFASAGITARNGAEAQALIHRHRAYCSLRKCYFCPWGRHLLSMSH